MRILSIDTSGSICGAAVVDATVGLLASAAVNVDALKGSHSVYLMTIIDSALKEAGFQVSDIDAFAVVVGPGSFTGLRVGIATINGLRYATGKPAVGVSSLEALAWNFPFAAYPVCSIIDARQGEVYGALLRWSDGGFKTIVEPQLFDIADLLALKAFINEGRVIFTGNGAAAYKSQITTTLRDRALFLEAAHISPYVVGMLGIKQAARGEFSTELMPVYLKMPLAVEKLNSANL
ncbi:MAG: tRNA (adenosine(37)-N6)-threonylcarbamoyltransferase complex dimerization subunit type 1 TsaB [Nitrospirae bacterium]|nr:tRNA (adenosine(37)-N6)-threonylcarbamoyltransferase complex dimerization subunit type 1 TsaB [Nitrospirota bacterium]